MTQKQQINYCNDLVNTTTGYFAIINVTYKYYKDITNSAQIIAAKGTILLNSNYPYVN